MKSKIKSLFEHDYIEAFSKNKSMIAFDEAGYGCLLGSMFVASVTFPIWKSFEALPKELYEVRDSKKLPEKKRASLAEEIKRRAKSYWVHEVSASELDANNAYQLRYTGAEEYVSGLNQDELGSAVVYFDGNKALSLSLPEHIENRFLIKGDDISLSIAAASILAKNAKDEEIKIIDKEFPQYKLISNKGYGTKDHIEAISKYGICRYHRIKYCKKYI